MLLHGCNGILNASDGFQHKEDGGYSRRSSKKIRRDNKRIPKKGVSTEKAVQNYAQTFIDNDRAIIKNLHGIKEELAQLKQAQPQTKISGAPSENQEKLNSVFLEKIAKLEAQIQALNSKTGGQTTKSPNTSNK